MIRFALVLFLVVSACSDDEEPRCVPDAIGLGYEAVCPAGFYPVCGYVTYECGHFVNEYGDVYTSSPVECDADGELRCTTGSGIRCAPRDYCPMSDAGP